MSNICLLIAATPVVEPSNYIYLGKALITRGHQVTYCFVDSLRLKNSVVTTSGFTTSNTLVAGENFPTNSDYALSKFEIVWVLSLGMRVSFLDKIQLLYTLPSSTKIVNTLDAIMHLKSKYLLTARHDIFTHPETHASSNADELFGIMAGKGGDWIAKPPAGSLGRDVFLLNAEDRNAKAILQNLCGYDNEQFTLLQRYIPEISKAGEKRVILAGGHVIGQYARHAVSDHRTNRHQGAQIQACNLSSDERTYCERLAQALPGMGAYFSGIDLVYPWIIEVNVINPGGISTLIELGQADISTEVVDRVIASAST